MSYRTFVPTAPFSRAGAIALILFAAQVAAAAAATYQVGPARGYKKLQDVATLLRPGDVVEVDGNATYPGDVTFRAHGLASSPITIRGISVSGKRPLISGGTNTVHFRTDTIGQGADHYVMENFEITGGSSRCVFHQADDVTLRSVVVHDCPNQGILGADWGAGSLTVELSEVYRTGSTTQGHQIYASSDEDNYPNAVFRLQHSWIHDGNGGNNIKSRAARNEIYYNRIEGAYYHELELIGSECCAESLVREDGDVVGNLFIRKSDFYVVRFGGDGTGQSWGRYRFVNNTVIAGASAVFRLFDGIESLEAHNNVFYRRDGPVNVVRTAEAVWSNGQQIVGTNNWMVTGTTNVAGSWSGTITGSDPGFTNAGGFDYSPTATSPLLNRANASPSGPAGFALPNPLFPPTNQPPGPPGRYGVKNPRPSDGALDIGAYERAGSTTTTPPAPPSGAVARVNAGGPAFVDASGNSWSADRNYNTGNTGNTATWSGANGDLYATERWDPSTAPELSYSFPVSPGTYTVRLHFAEIYSGAAFVGGRQFDVLLNGSKVLDHLDIFKEVGFLAPLVKTFTVSVSGSELRVDFVHQVENPKISGIEILVADGSTPPAPSATRVNAGGPGLTDAAGHAWDADRGYNTGNTGTASWAGSDPQLYGTERWDPSASPELAYAFTVSPGSYQVSLHFAEIYTGAAFTGGRVFDVFVNGTKVLDHFDIFKEAGFMKPLVKSFTVSVTGTQITVSFAHLVENPKVSGIEIVPR